MSKKHGAATWHAEVLRDEAERLAVACRALEFGLGFLEGREAGGIEARRALAVRPWDKTLERPVSIG